MAGVWVKVSDSVAIPFEDGGAVAGCLQSLAIANLGSPLPSDFVRTGLSSPFNTKPDPSASGIGVMPDLAAVKKALVP